MRVRLADVAANAGVSEATVSRVLNGKPGISDTQRIRILTALEVLGYERPPRARTKKTGLVGLIVPELDNPVFPALAQIIETDLAREGYTSVLCTQTPEGVHEDEYVRMLLDRRVAGIIFVSGIHANLDTEPDRYIRLREQHLPIVLINGYLPGIDAPFLSIDDAAGVHLAVEHCAALGHRRIGLAMGPPRYVPVHRKIAAFHAAMRAYVDPAASPDALDALVECTVFSVDGGAAAVTALLQRGVTAVVCGSDLMALGAMRAARAAGLRLPQDLSIVGSDDIPLVEFVAPPLTTLRSPIAVIAAAAARALLDELAGAAPPRAEYMFRPQLVVRGSTVPPAAGSAAGTAGRTAGRTTGRAAGQSTGRSTAKARGDDGRPRRTG